MLDFSNNQVKAGISLESAAPRISVLIPTYQRYGRLYRNLLYIQSMLSNAEFEDILCKVEFIIADGSPGNYVSENIRLRDEIIELASSINPRVKLDIFFQPDKTLFERLVFLAQAFSGEYVTMLGDEDFLVFDNLERMQSMLSDNQNVSAVTGIYFDIKGFRSLGRKLKILSEEGILFGSHINGETFFERLLQSKLLTAAGGAPISYSLMRSYVFKKYGNYLDNINKSLLTYCSAEIILNVFLLSAGQVKIIDTPFVMRDFTYLSHSSVDPIWSNQKVDFDSLVQVLNHELSGQQFNSDEFMGTPIQLAKHLSLLGKLGLEPRKALFRLNAQFTHKSPIDLYMSRLHSHTLYSATKAWRKTIGVCYSPSEIGVVGASVWKPLRFLERIRSKALFLQDKFSKNKVV